jgi:membrane-associated phospholipid phosphatase
VAFVALAIVRQRGRLIHLDLRIITHIVPGRQHPRLIDAMQPLTHLGDAVFLVPVSIVALVALRLLGYRRSWVVLIGLLSWPIELACKATLDQPGALDPYGQHNFGEESVQLRSMVHGAGARQVFDWLDHAVPGLSALIQHAGSTTVGLTSSFPSGTTARGAFALGLLAWLCLLVDVPFVSELLALALFGVAGLVGIAVMLFAWHLPSDVLGGYLLGFALLAVALALLRRPDEDEDAPAYEAPHGRHARAASEAAWPDT